MDAHTRPEDAFAVIAGQYCKMVEACSVSIGVADAEVLSEVLSRMYGAALALPAVEPTDDAAEPRVASMRDRFDFGNHDLYWETAHPYSDDQPIRARLTDDLSDIYRDVKGGLLLFEKGFRSNAVFHWRLLLESHWGDHLVDALRALHRLVCDARMCWAEADNEDCDEGDPSANPGDQGGPPPPSPP